MLEITFLIVSVLVVLFIIHYQTKKAEPFEDFYLQACPSGYDTLFYDENDVASCCEASGHEGI